jgi:DMSO/TMAO reductase YedYZ molybdopterin-dependent catalytic subunit
VSPITRGFHGKRDKPPASRVPPGQHVIGDFPVLSAGPTPHKPLRKWTFSITGGREPKSWTWEEFRALPAETITVDIHCVTTGSKLDTRWKGVSLDVLLSQVEHDARYVLAFCDGGYTTNLPLADLTGGKAWVAFGFATPTSRASGRPTATTCMETHGWNSGTRATDLADRIGRHDHQRDTQGAHHQHRVPEWPGHRAGQHVDTRLTAEDGYQA